MTGSLRRRLRIQVRETPLRAVRLGAIRPVAIAHTGVTKLCRILERKEKKKERKEKESRNPPQPALLITRKTLRHVDTLNVVVHAKRSVINVQSLTFRIKTRFELVILHNTPRLCFC